MKAVQKIVLQGHSAMVTIPRAMLFRTSLRPGDWVEWEMLDEVTIRLRPWRNTENVSHQSPGVLTPDPAAVTK